MLSRDHSALGNAFSLCLPVTVAQVPGSVTQLPQNNTGWKGPVEETSG